MNPIQIPYEDLKSVNAPYFEGLVASAKECIEGGWYVLGDFVKEFEDKFGAIHNNCYCIGVASGLDALILGLSVYGFPKGSKVLLPSNTYIASILAVLRADLIPILVEPDPFTYNITAEGLEKNWDSSCVAVLPVHLYGRMCPMNEIMEFAQIKNLKVIEDCAQSHFAQIGNKKSGTIGDIGAFSFYPTKNLGALGDAGAILCKDQEIYMRLLALRNYGSHQKYHNKYIGWNSRLDEMQAGFLLSKLNDFQTVVEHKRKLALAYIENLNSSEKIQIPLNAMENHVWHIFNILVHNRDIIRNRLLRAGIGTEIHYPIPPHHQEGYKFVFSGSYPISERIHRNTLSLPISTCHTEDDILMVVEELMAIL